MNTGDIPAEAGQKSAGDAGIYLTNATAMWRSLAPHARDHAGHFRAELPAVTRILLTRPATPAAVARLIDDAAPDPAVVVEDVFGAAPAGTPGVRVLRMPVMVRPAAPVVPPAAVAPPAAPVAPPGVPVAPPAAPVVRGAGEGERADAERVVVDGFPLPLHQPLVRGRALPPRVLRLPGWRVWLAHHGGRPAAAVCTYDDGAAVGVYWLATLPGYRSRGLARAALSTAIAAHPDRSCTLVATDAGVPLYESLGFRTVATTTWLNR